MYVCGGGGVVVIIVRMCRYRHGTTWCKSHKTGLQSLNKCSNQSEIVISILMIIFSIVTYHLRVIVISNVQRKLIMIQRLFKTMKPYIFILTKVD